MADDTTNREGGEGSDYIKIKVVGSENNEVHFRVKMSTQLSKLKRTYSDKMGVPLTSLRFLFDGNRVNDEDTPRSLDMENDDTIEVFQEQTGGCAY